MERRNFFPYTWHIDEKETETTVIRVYGIDEKNENVCVQINDFTPYVYLELPCNINWTESRAQILGDKIDRMMKEKKPLQKQLLWKHRLYGAHLETRADGKSHRKKFPFLFCKFATRSEIKQFSWKLRSTLQVPGLGGLRIKMHEQDANEVLQLTCCKDIPTAGWIRFSGTRVEDDDKVTNCDHEFVVKWKNFKKLDRNTVGKPKWMGFDLEVNSSNPTAMPNADKPDDKIFQISCVFTREGEPEEKSYLLSLGDPNQHTTGEKIIIRRFETEADLLIGFTDLVNEENPNVITGYNIFSFDIPYMIDRAKLLYNIYNFDKLGFHKFNHAIEKTIKWSSSAYKDQEFQFLDAEGRLFVDLLPIVKRDYKMDNYKLKTISTYFIGETKDPLSYKGIFKCYQLGMEGGSTGSKALGICGRYCIQDSALVVKLAEKLQVWVGLCEMAKTCNVPIFSIFTQGQQLKVYSQVYKFCMYNNIVVEKDGYITKENERYVGAHVFPPEPGIYNRVLPFDFASLYPTCIIAYNIDYSTFVTDDDVPDSQCHVMEWADHVGCIHDPKVIRKMELTKHIDSVLAEVKLIGLKRDKTLCVPRRKEIQEEMNKMRASLKPYRDERKVITKPKYVMCEKRYYRFVKEPKGVIPTILQSLLDARRNTRNEIKKHKAEIANSIDEKEIEDLTLLNNVLNKRQLSYKISANSMYGALGVRRGYLPFMPAAMCTTYMGRKSIELVAEVIPKKYGGQLVYGDSVTGDTPILVRYSNKSIDLKTIDTLGQDWNAYDGFKAGESNRREKEQSLVDVEVWSDGKWTKLKRVIRHKTVKKLCRILTHTGCVDVTEDHSLLDIDGKIVKPSAVEIGDRLLHSFPDKFDKCDITVGKAPKTRKCKKCGKKKSKYEFYRLRSTGTLNIKSCKECAFYSNNRHNLEGKTYVSDYEYLNAGYNNLSVGEAFVWGFFMADGSGGKYEKSGKYSWAINNQNLEYLNRAKNYLENCEPTYKFKILDTMKSSHVYKLVPAGKIRLIAQKYQKLFYDKDKHKIVPYPILNASSEVKEMFFEGYYVGDGYKSEPGRIIPTKCLRMDCKGKIGTQGLYVVLKSLGYFVSINTRKDKPDIYRLNASKNSTPRRVVDAIKKVTELRPLCEDEFVYDLETEQGRFHAGIGELVVKNTDSNYIHFPSIETPEESWDYAEKVAAEVSKLFPKPMVLEFEEAIYWRFLILTKKRYMYKSCGRDGVVEDKIGKKGVLLARRDNSGFVKKLYEQIIMKIFGRVERDEILDYLVGKINEMCSGTVKAEDFVVTKSVSSVGDRDEEGHLIPVPFTTEKGEEKEKIGSYTVTPLSNNEERRADQLKNKKVSSASEYYEKSLPAQVQLGERMKRRGQLVDAGSRLEYVITETGGHTAKQYDKIESSEYWMAHKHVIKLDFLYYLKQLTNPMDQVLNVMYDKSRSGGDSNGFTRDFTLKQYKLRVARMKMLAQLRGLFRPKIVLKQPTSEDSWEFVEESEEGSEKLD